MNWNLRLTINMFGLPALFFVCSIGLQLIRVPIRPAFSSVDPFIVGISLLFLIIAIGWACRSIWVLVQAHRGIGDLCHECGMPAKLVEPGRFGPYFKCMACGSNRAVR